MKRLIFIVAMHTFSQNVFAQKIGTPENSDDKLLQVLDEKFKLFAVKNFSVKGQVKLYRYNELAEIEDTFLADYLSATKLPNYHGFNYNLDSLSESVRLIFDKIDSIPNSKSDFISHIPQIDFVINKLAKKKEILFAKDYYVYHFRLNQDSTLLCYLKRIGKIDWISHAPKNINAFDFQDILLAEGVRNRSYSLPLSLFGFHSLLMISDSLEDFRRSGQMYLQMGELYMSRKSVPSYLSAERLFLDATQAFLKIHDSAMITFSQLEYARSKLPQLAFPVYPEEIIGSTHDISLINDPKFVLDKEKEHANQISKKFLIAVTRALQYSGNRYCKHQFCLLLGEYFSMLKSNEIAYAYLFESLAFSQSTDDLLSSLISLSDYYSKNGKYSNATKLLNLALKYAKSTDNTIVPMLYYKKGEVLSADDPKNAVENIYHSIALCDSLGLLSVPKLNVLVCDYLLLSDIFSSQHMADSALKYQNEISNIYAVFSSDQARMEKIDKSLYIQEKNNELDTQYGIVKKSKNAIYYLSGTVAIIVLILFVIVWLKNRKVKKVRIQLNAIAKGKIHNIQNNYSSIYNLVRKKEFVKAKGYADASSYFFRLLVDKGDLEEKKWTIDDELEILKFFCLREERLGKNVEITKDFEGLHTDQIRFLPEIFTTLLHNSIRHGLIDTNKTLIFNIKIEKRGKKLLFTISDNGTPSDKPYIRKERPYKGLSLLKMRIINELRSDFTSLMLKDKFQIVPIKGVGTTIKFKFPYATVKDIHSRRQFRRSGIIARFTKRKRV